MVNEKRIYGPVPSRRLGLSLGVSPIPNKVCNYSCVYCQLGRTNRMTNQREDFFKLEEILAEFQAKIETGCQFDVVTIVGEGEPTLYAQLEELILGLKQITDRPIAVITNGALLYDGDVRKALNQADIVLPSYDAGDEETFVAINRPIGSIRYGDVVEGLRRFSHEYQGQLWVEIMLVRGLNDSDEQLAKLKEGLKEIRHDRVYVNAPIRPPAEASVQEPLPDRIKEAVAVLGGISIDQLVSEGFYSEEFDHLKAVLNIIQRHPMNQHEIAHFLQTRDCENPTLIFDELAKDPHVEGVFYKGYTTYRIRK